jgi:hypothetical protein
MTRSFPWVWILLAAVLLLIPGRLDGCCLIFWVASPSLSFCFLFWRVELPSSAGSC